MTRDQDDDLMVRYIEGVATDQDVASLETRLAAEPGLRREFVRLAHLQALFLDLPRPAAVQTNAHGRLRFWTFAAAGLAAAVLIANTIWMMLSPSPELPTITSLSGQIACLHGHTAVPLRVGDRLETGDHLTLGSNADLAMSWKDHSVVHLNDASDLMVNASRDVTLTLNAGNLVANITHDPRRPFTIATVDGLVTDIGTSFTILRDPTGTSVSVDAGIVSFANAAGEVIIMTGRTATASAGQAPLLAPAVAIAIQPEPAASVPPSPPAAPVSPSATGIVTALNQQRKSFTLKDDGTGLTNEYRAYFAGGHTDDILAQIAALKVGDHLTVTYIDKEGRRVKAITK